MSTAIERFLNQDKIPQIIKIPFLDKMTLEVKRPAPEEVRVCTLQALKSDQLTNLSILASVYQNELLKLIEKNTCGWDLSVEFSRESVRKFFSELDFREGTVLAKSFEACLKDQEQEGLGKH